MSDDRLKKLQEKRDQLNARIAKESGRISAQKRKDQTRAKIILGAVAAQLMAEEPQVKLRMVQRLLGQKQGYRRISDRDIELLQGLEVLTESDCITP